jgi:hypothetical protein
MERLPALQDEMVGPTAPMRSARVPAWPPEKRADAARAGLPQTVSLLILCALVGGCSANHLEAPLFITDPGKFQYHNCDQLNDAARAASARANELKTLMGKADQGLAGPIVGTVAYQGDYIAAKEDLRLIEETSRAKNCVTPETWQSNTVIR